MGSIFLISAQLESVMVNEKSELYFHKSFLKKKRKKEMMVLASTEL